jgi:hypothetical protein
MRAALLATLLLAACSAGREELPAPQLPERTGVDPLVAARAEGVEFRAVGDGLVADIFRTERIRLTRTATSEELVFPRPQPQNPPARGTIYETASDGHTLLIEIRDSRPCETGDSALYPTSVVIVLDHEEIHACGRAF